MVLLPSTTMTNELYPGATPLELRAIHEIVALAMDAPIAAKSGHTGTAMALAPLGVALFSRVLRHDPSDPKWADRDRFILSCGHASLLQYGLAHAFGYDVSQEDLRAFRQPHSRTPGHPEVGVTETVEVTTGPLGQGFANGVGMAMAERLLRATFGEDLVNHHTWVIAGDGCLQEGISHEAAALAGHLGLDRLTVVYDDNHITIDGTTEISGHGDVAQRFASYGWNVIEAGESAHDVDAMERALRQSTTSSAPTLIVIRSHIGYPSTLMMDTREAHGSPFSADAVKEVKALLGRDPDASLVFDNALPDDAREHLHARGSDLHSWNARVQAAGERGRDFLEQLNTGGVRVSESANYYDEGASVATRKALQRVMDDAVSQSPGLVAGSADLTENTGVLLKGAAAMGAMHPDGRQVFYGIREFAMGAALVGMTLHGGVRAVGSTFFVFSDYVRPAIRLAALSEAPAVFVFTHDSIGVGEDGPTHQPIEHLMSLRAMPGLHVVRPSDANEAIDCARQAVTGDNAYPIALILSRQDLPVLSGDAAAASRAGYQRGGYVVRDAVNAVASIAATGSEVSVALDAAELLAQRGLEVRVIALPCWACFDEQPRDYRESVLRRDLPSLSIEAGSTLGWYKYVDSPMGIDTFGMSAPASFIFDYFNITPHAVADAVANLEGLR